MSLPQNPPHLKHGSKRLIDIVDKQPSHILSRHPSSSRIATAKLSPLRNMQIEPNLTTKRPNNARYKHLPTYYQFLLLKTADNIACRAIAWHELAILLLSELTC